MEERLEIVIRCNTGIGLPIARNVCPACGLRRRPGAIALLELPPSRNPEQSPALPPDASTTSARYFSMTDSSFAMSLSADTHPESIKANEEKNEISRRDMTVKLS